MTISELQAKRQEILEGVREMRVTFSDGRSIEFTDSTKALAAIDAEIARANSQAAGGSRFRTSFASFTK